jgi:hypothetical protein
VEPHVVLDVGIAPAGALTRVAGAINRRPKRALGIFKTGNEYVGRVWDDGFEVWERRQRAVHASGRIRARQGGSRIELRFVLPARTRLLIAVFFVLYAAAAAGIGFRSDGAFSVEDLAIACLGAASVGLVFVLAAGRQRAELRGFIRGLFADLPRT